MGSFSAGATGNVAGAITEVAGGSTELGTAGVNGAANTSADLTFAAAVTGTQSISINAMDASGNQHSLTVNLSAPMHRSDGRKQRAQHHQRGSPEVRTIPPCSRSPPCRRAAALRAPSTSSARLQNFTVNVGADSVGNTEGVATATAGVGQTHTAMAVGTGSTADISTVAGATSAVSAVGAAVELWVPRKPPSVRAKTSSTTPSTWRVRRSPTSPPRNRRFAIPMWRSKPLT